MPDAAATTRAPGFGGVIRDAGSLARSGGLHPFGVAVLLAGAFLPVADFFIVNVALPTIARDLHASGPTLELIVAGYGVAYASLLVLGGRLGDRYGRDRLFSWGLWGFIAASLTCGLAPSIWVLVGARIVQGAAAAMLIPQVLATFHASLEGDRRARALAMYGATAGIAGVVGQVLGGLLVSADIAGTQWRPIFLINVPIGLAVLAVARAVVPATRSPHPVGIDRVGTTLFAATLVCLLVPLTEGQKLGWPAWVWAVLAVAFVLAWITVVVAQRLERRGGVPLMPPSVVRLPSMWRGSAMLLPFTLGFGSFMFVFALTTQEGLHYSALHGGAAMVPLAVMFLLGSIYSPKIIGRYGRGAMAAGAATSASGLIISIIVMVELWPHVTMFELAIPMAMMGAGQSMLFAGLFRITLADVPMQHAGIGGGALVTLQQSGFALGVATLGTLFLARVPYGFSGAYAAAVGAQAVIMVVLSVATRGLPSFAPQVSPDVAVAEAA